MAFTLEIGDKAPDFNLPGVDGHNYVLANFAKSKVLVLVFSCNHCPAAIGSEDRMIEFHADFHPRGVGLVAVNSNEDVNHPGDSFDKMIERARDKGFEFPYVRDRSQVTARAYGALRTPHFFVFDADRKLRYTGRMDDNPYEAAKATTSELVDAVEALLDGKAPPLEVTNPIGCNVKWAGQEEHWMPPESCDLV